MTMEILKVQDLCKTYGKGEAKVEALKKVSLSLDKGEFAAVVGESGSGKSTLLNCIGALDTPTSGHILVDGQDLFSMKEEQRTIFRRRNIGFIFQSFQLVSELNVEQNIIFPLLLDYQARSGRGRRNLGSLGPYRTSAPPAESTIRRTAAACRHWTGVNHKAQTDFGG